MTKEEIEIIVNDKAVKLFYQVIERGEFLGISGKNIQYKYLNIIFEISISDFSKKEHKYIYNNFEQKLMNWYFTPIFSYSEKWCYSIVLPKEFDKSNRIIPINITDEIELNRLKGKFLQLYQDYELTFLDKYLEQDSNLPF